jgi:hypothetical protein
MRLLTVATRLLPPADQARYLEELRAELASIAEAGSNPQAQVTYAARQLASAWHLRTELGALPAVQSVRLAHLARNLAALAPLIFTWIMLGMAAWQYKHEIHSTTDPQVKTTSFLLLWQQGFGTRFWSFELVAFVDVSLLLLMAALTVWVHWTERADRPASRGPLNNLAD